MTAKYVQVITTLDKKETAEKIARALVEMRLAACAQVLGPIQSCYRWQDRLEATEEWQCLIKSRADRYLDLEEVIKILHPYEVPEIIVMPIIGGHEAYLAWLNENIDPGEP